MFSKAQYNRSAFNRVINADDTDLYATITIETGMTIAAPVVMAAISPITMNITFDTPNGQPGLYYPAGAVTAGIDINIAAQQPSVRVPLGAVTIELENNLIPGALRLAESAEMNFESVNLAPGKTMIIDTDTLEIEIDGVPNVDCWVSGGTFFQLKNGANRLTFADNSATRNLVVTVVWADRYL